MNTQLLSRLGRASATPSFRAQFSPLVRRLTPHFSALSPAGSRVDYGRSRGASLTPEAFETRSDRARIRWWDTHLVDRLSAPLTRYRD
jgi:hypothetical protein